MEANYPHMADESMMSHALFTLPYHTRSLKYKVNSSGEVVH